VGAGITAENVHDSAACLVGACSCEVKELNPGFDLLLSGNWDDLLTQAGVVVPADAGPAPAASEEPVLVPIPRGSATRAAKVEVTPTPTAVATAAEPAGQSNASLFVVGGISVGAVLGVAFLFLALLPRSKPAA
jgi:hypothetical protein